MSEPQIDADYRIAQMLFFPGSSCGSGA